VEFSCQLYLRLNFTRKQVVGHLLSMFGEESNNLISMLGVHKQAPGLLSNVLMQQFYRSFISLGNPPKQ